jgi:hypothetical protein
MSKTKQYILIFLVVVALIQTGVGGLRDMFGLSLFNISSQHSWHDAIILLLLAILVAIVMK